MHSRCVMRCGFTAVRPGVNTGAWNENIGHCHLKGVQHADISRESDVEILLGPKVTDAGTQQ